MGPFDGSISRLTWGRLAKGSPKGIDSAKSLKYIGVIYANSLTPPAPRMNSPPPKYLKSLRFSVRNVWSGDYSKGILFDWITIRLTYYSLGILFEGYTIHLSYHSPRILFTSRIINRYYYLSCLIDCRRYDLWHVANFSVANPFGCAMV